jgi:hypothetical protein
VPGVLVGLDASARSGAGVVVHDRPSGAPALHGGYRFRIVRDLARLRLVEHAREVVHHAQERRMVAGAGDAQKLFEGRAILLAHREVAHACDRAHRGLVAGAAELLVGHHVFLPAVARVVEHAVLFLGDVVGVGLHPFGVQVEQILADLLAELGAQSRFVEQRVERADLLVVGLQHRRQLELELDRLGLRRVGRGLCGFAGLAAVRLSLQAFPRRLSLPVFGGFRPRALRPLVCRLPASPQRACRLPQAWQLRPASRPLSRRHRIPRAATACRS